MPGADNQTDAMKTLEEWIEGHVYSDFGDLIYHGTLLLQDRNPQTRDFEYTQFLKSIVMLYAQFGKEVDFLIVDKKKITPIEIKNKIEVTKNDLKDMKYFLRKYSIKEGLVIYNGKKAKDKEINFIPLWKWLLKN